MDRYIKNQLTLSEEENQRLHQFRVVVAGCGGIGGYLIEMLARLGIGHITAVDGDVFELTNLNRQLLSHPENLGQPKATAARERVLLINPDIRLIPVISRITENNALEILSGHHLIFDALDNIPSRKILQNAAESMGIPMIHAAIAGWYLQISTIIPGDRTLDLIYPEDYDKGEETFLGNPSFTPALAAAYQVAEGLKVLLNRGNILQRKLLIINTLENIHQIIDL